MKQLSVSMLGFAFGFVVLAATPDPAAADRGKTRWIEPAPGYTYDGKTQKRGAVAIKPRQDKRKFENTLDFETEAVWRNLRPNRFDD